MDKTDSSDGRLIEREARKRVGTKLGFYIHALVFVLVNAGLWAVNAWLGGERWAIYPFLGWGLGLAIHGMVVAAALSGGSVRRRMLDAEVARLRARR